MHNYYARIKQPEAAARAALQERDAPKSTPNDLTNASSNEVRIKIEHEKSTPAFAKAADEAR